MTHSLTWTVGHAQSPDEIPSEFVPARVPGAVQLDWARAHDWPDYTYCDNYKAYGWMEDVFWVYRAALPNERMPGMRLFFVCKGIDYRFQVRVGGQVLHDQEGMFTPFELDLTDPSKPGDVLEVVVWPAPKSRPSPQDRAQADQSCKPAVSLRLGLAPAPDPPGHLGRDVLGHATQRPFVGRGDDLRAVRRPGAGGRNRLGPSQPGRAGAGPLDIA